MSDEISLPVKMLAAASHVTVDEMTEYLLRKGTGNLELKELRPTYIRKALADETSVLIRPSDIALKKLPKIEIDVKPLFISHSTVRFNVASQASVATTFPKTYLEKIAREKGITLVEFTLNYMLEYMYGDYDFVLVRIIPRTKRKKSQKIIEKPIDISP